MKIAILISKEFKRRDFFLYYMKKYHYDLFRFNDEAEVEIVSENPKDDYYYVNDFAISKRHKLTYISADNENDETQSVKYQKIIDYADCCIAFNLGPGGELSDVIKRFQAVNKKTYFYFSDDKSIIEELFDDLDSVMPTVSEQRLSTYPDLDYDFLFPQPLYQIEGKKGPRVFAERIEGGLFFYKAQAEKVLSMLPQDINWKILNIPIKFADYTERPLVSR